MKQSQGTMSALDQLESMVRLGAQLSEPATLSLIASARELEAVTKTLAAVGRDSEATASLSVQKLVLETLTREKQRDEARDWLGQIADLVQGDDEDIEPDVTLSRLRGLLSLPPEPTNGR